MTELLTREFTAHLEVRVDGRTLEGVAVTYGTEAYIGSYTEVFVRGAFANADEHPLMVTHPRDGGPLPIGRSVELEERADGLHGAWHVSDTDLGNEVLTLVRDGVPLGLSIGFVEGRSRWNPARTRVERLTAALDHVAVVRKGAYPGTGVTRLRSADDARRPRLTVARYRT
jgi:HK97 family phage prohead protease